MIRWLPRPVIPWIGFTPAGDREATMLVLRHHYRRGIVRDLYEAHPLLVELERRRQR